MIKVIQTRYILATLQQRLFYGWFFRYSFANPVATDNHQAVRPSYTGSNALALYFLVDSVGIEPTTSHASLNPIKESSC